MAEIEERLSFQDNYNVKSKIGEEQVYFSDIIKKKDIRYYKLQP